MENKRESFTGSIGFVLAAAGSAVGLGNIWRFPYLAARDGGGLFLLIYLLFALTFGFTLLTTEIAIGRKTKKSPLTAYGELRKKWKPLGLLACIIPMIIMPYYCVIGGWVVKYFIEFITFAESEAAADGYFGSFISETASPIAMTTVFLFLTAIIVLGGVKRGIEKISKILMPALVILIIIISFFSLTLSYTDADNVTRTGLEGLKILFIPDFSEITFSGLFSIMMDAMGQLFYSLSVAMGIMIAYGSYLSDDANLTKSVSQIEIFDTGIAYLAGVMVIPAVYVFMGKEGMQSSGPGLMFISLPKVFAQMGFLGDIVGCLFFAMVLFAAVTSAVSILEAVVSSFMDEFHISRSSATFIECLIAWVFGVIVCLGYNKLYFNVTLPNGAEAQVLDIMDYASNNIMMPVVTIGTCILMGWILKPDVIIKEATKNGEKFGREAIFRAMLRYIAPVLLVVLLLRALGVF